VKNIALRSTKIFPLIVTRAALVSFLLLSAIIGDLKGVPPFPPSARFPFYLLLFSTYGLSALYILLLSLVKTERINIYLQCIIDVVVVTYLVYITGGSTSIYSVFYTLIIIYAVLFLGKGGTFVVASLCVIFYGLLLDMEYYGLLNPLFIAVDDYPFQTSYVLSRLATHLLSFYLIAYLASFVVEREKKAQTLLAEKEDAFKQLDLLHQSIVESVNLGIITINRSGRIKSINRAALEIAGFTFAEVIDREIYALFPRLEEIKHSPEKKDRFELEIGTKEGKVLILGCSLSPLMDSGGEQIGDILIFQDLTMIKKMEEEYEKSRKMALIGEMAARLAHEIRNPLATISGSLQVLRKDMESLNIDERLFRIIMRGKEQLENFMRDFLLLARPMPGSFSVVSLRELLNEVLDALRYNECWHEGISVNNLMEGNFSFYANPSEIRQVLWNILLNASQAIADTGVITVTSRHLPHGFEIAICDDGCGIEKKDLKKVFEPFFTTKDRGTGLGLAITRRVMEDLGGRVEIESTPGSGTKVTLFFPAKVMEEQKDGASSRC